MECNTAAQLVQRYVGRKALLGLLSYDQTHAGPQYRNVGIEVPVEILDARVRWGNEELLCRPYRGTGSSWVRIGARVKRRSVRVVSDWPKPEPELMGSDADGEGITDVAQIW